MRLRIALLGFPVLDIQATDDEAEHFADIGSQFIPIGFQAEQDWDEEA